MISLDQTAYALIKIMAIDTCYHYWKSNGWVKDEKKTPKPKLTFVIVRGMFVDLLMLLSIQS